MTGTVNERTRTTHTEAVVIGGGYAGLLAAAVLAHSGHDVLIVGGGGGRGGEGGGGGAGAAVARPPRLLRTGGQGIDGLLYGATRALRAAGARSSLLAVPPRAAACGSGTGISEFLSCSPELLARVVRTEVLARPGYERETLWWEDARAVGLLGDREEVRGVVVRSEDGTTRSVRARLVVDAGGAPSAVASRLAALGVPEAPRSVAGRAGSCATRLYSVSSASADIPLTVATAAGRPALAAPLEGGRWALSQYAHGPAPLPRGLTFEEAAAAFADPSLRRLVAEGEPLTDVAVAEVPGAHWCHYERVRPWPRRFVVLGGAVAGFGLGFGLGFGSGPGLGSGSGSGPADGWGPAGTEAAVRTLRNELAHGGISHPTLARRVQREIAEQVARAWAGPMRPGSARFRPAATSYVRALSGGFLRRGPR
ncbi:FAD-dependent oxidoreductase [Streptomyces sp. NPDC006662]|uniref:FAD-dependent oxidoreductase n=1 Tax=Streptomyces sp. NPDC006662 TaxID=3156902 RepID=UPI0033DD33CC